MTVQPDNDSNTGGSNTASNPNGKKIFCILLLDEFQSDDPAINAYLIHVDESHDSFREFIRTHGLMGKYDTAMIAVVHKPDELVAKIKRQIGNKELFGDSFKYCYLHDSEVRLAHRLTSQHMEQYSGLDS